MVTIRPRSRRSQRPDPMQELLIDPQVRRALVDGGSHPGRHLQVLLEGVVEEAVELGHDGALDAVGRARRTVVERGAAECGQFLQTSRRLRDHHRSSFLSADVEPIRVRSERVPRRTGRPIESANAQASGAISLATRAGLGKRSSSMSSWSPVSPMKTSAIGRLPREVSALSTR
jgi:hypothetical protein